MTIDRLNIINDKLNKLILSFQKVLYEEDASFLSNMKTNNLAGDDIRKYQYWEWTQGVGLFGLWILFDRTHVRKYLDMLIKYYNEQIETGLPSKNINTCAPMLALSYIAEYTNNNSYLSLCDEWAQWIMNKLPKTKEGGFQHITSDTVNEQELWDDTLVMTVLFLANYGRITKNNEYIEEAKYQFLLHIKYLTDKKTGLWFHGWTFCGNHNFSEALWGRGNCWVTIAIPEFINMGNCEESVRRYLLEALQLQVSALKKFQEPSGMWHTIIDSQDSYLETSATCGFCYGILRAAHLGYIDDTYKQCAYKALDAVLNNITEDGIVNQVSYGTPMGRESKEFYKNIEIKPMPYGQALAILFLLEYLEDKDIM
ncbi:glycoside hydrolase family 105 protein [Anaerocolumna sedimenticola]|uniref:Glycoside hydrolase family 105 protein n=1 Tax=Anaerocolumna sedimenticola TaxID=2696063 RepID=A0A6P1TJK6_9FIRM|nr:glycoside hydrolase family 88 protein [Anaerocolumna sedimenticola]QHQ59825.1 glycoside hydrolase family 105 protein [Anaerocolumna sedimenticola]